MERNRVERWAFQGKKSLPLMLCAILCLCSPMHAAWQPAKGPLMTRWARQVSTQNVHREYPRPQMVRKDWMNLNGLWEYAIRPKDEQQPDRFDGLIGRDEGRRRRKPSVVPPRL